MNVKQGDLAIVIGGVTTPEMVGAIVEVVRPYIDGPVGGIEIEPSAVFGWVVRSQSSAGIAVRCIRSGCLDYVGERVVEDRLLRPISGLPDTDNTDTEQPIKEVA